MDSRATAALLMIAGVINGTATAQTPANPTSTSTIRLEQVPVFRVTVVGRTTSAINYRPRRAPRKSTSPARR